MKILQVMAGAEHGGAETACIDMCIALHERGETIEVVTRPNAVRVPALQNASIKTHTLPFGAGLDFYTPWRLKHIITKFQPDIVQSWLSRAPSKIPAWNPNMGIPRYAHVARLGGYYKTKYFKTADHLVTITPDIKKYLMREGLAADRITHINNFAETEKVITSINRAEFQTPDDALLILGLGRLHTSKGFDTLIKAVADLSDIYLWIAGEGPERAALESLIETLNVRDRVKLLGWRTDRAALFEACDICFFSSRYEPFGTVFVQAWAQKTPLISTDADGPKQYVRHEEDGLLVPIDNVKAFKEAITRLKDDPDLQNFLTRNGYARYLNEFSKEKTIEAYLSCYRNLDEN